MPAVFTDDFAGSPGALLKSRTSPVAWTYYGNSAGVYPNWALLNTGGTQLKAVTNNTLSAYLTGNVGSADMYAQAAVYTASGQTCCVVLRAADYQNYIGVQHYTNSQLRLVKCVGGTVTAIPVTLAAGGTASGAFTLATALQLPTAAGSVVRLEAEGTTIRVYKGGTLIATATSVTEGAYNQKAGISATATIASNQDPWLDNFEAGTLYTIAESLGVNELPAYRVFQRKKGTNAADIAVSGSYSSTTIASIEYQVTDFDDGTVRQAWTALGTPTIGSNAWSGMVSVPVATAGKVHRLLFRSKDAGGNILFVTSTATRWTVGITILGLGQSNMDALFGTTASTVEAFTGSNAYMGATGGWSQPSTTKGAGAFANLLSSLLDMPVGIMEAAESNKDIRYLAPAHVSNGSSIPDGANWAPTLAVLANGGNDVEAALWTQGETAYSGQTYQGYYDALAAIVAALKTATGRTGAGEFRFGISIIGDDLSVTATDANNLSWQATQQAQHDVALNVAGAFISHSAYDLPMTAGEPHYSSPDGYTEHGRRFARSYAAQLGASAYSARGLEIDPLRVGGVGTKAIIGLKANGLGALEANTAFTGFEYRDPATTNWVATTAAREDSYSVSLTVAAGTTAIRYAYGRQPDATNVARSVAKASPSSTLGLPVMTPRESSFTVFPLTLIDVTAATAAPAPQAIGVIEPTIIDVSAAIGAPAPQTITVVSADAIVITAADAAPVAQLVMVSEGFNVAINPAVNVPTVQVVDVVEAVSIAVAPASAAPVAQSITIISATGLVAPSGLIFTESSGDLITAWTDNSVGEGAYEWIAVVQYPGAGDPGADPLLWTLDDAKGRAVVNPGLLPANTTTRTLFVGIVRPGAEVYVAVRSRLGTLGSDWLIGHYVMTPGLPQVPGEIVVHSIPGGLTVEFAQYPAGSARNYNDETSFKLEIAIGGIGNTPGGTKTVAIPAIPGFAQGLVGSVTVDTIALGFPVNTPLTLRLTAINSVGSIFGGDFIGTAGVIPTVINVASAVIPPLPQDVFVSVGLNVAVAPASVAPTPQSIELIYMPLVIAPVDTPLSRRASPPGDVRNASA